MSTVKLVTWEKMSLLNISEKNINWTNYCTMNKNWLKVFKLIMPSRWTDHDLPLSVNVRPLRSPRDNVSVNGVCQLLDKWDGRGREGLWGVYIPGWRVVFKGLVASTKTLCSAPCLLNRAKLIWVCFRAASFVSWATVSLPPLSSTSTGVITVVLKDTLTGRTVVDAHILQRKKCWPLSRRVVCQTTW